MCTWTTLYSLSTSSGRHLRRQSMDSFSRLFTDSRVLFVHRTTSAVGVGGTRTAAMHVPCDTGHVVPRMLILNHSQWSALPWCVQMQQSSAWMRPLSPNILTAKAVRVVTLHLSVVVFCSSFIVFYVSCPSFASFG